jgi:hypothetical protein
MFTACVVSIIDTNVSSRVDELASDQHLHNEGRVAFDCGMNGFDCLSAV